jgi:cold shock protein
LRFNYGAHTNFATEMGEKMPQGTVRWYNQEKGFGMIKPSDGSADVFVSAADLVALVTLKEGEFVVYELEKTRKGQLKAVYVRM